jgi:PAS domain S-box-containing protein
MDYVYFTLGFLLLIFSLFSLAVGRLGSLKTAAPLLAAAGMSGMVYFWLLFLQLIFPPDPGLGFFVVLAALVFGALFFWAGLRMTLARAGWRQALLLAIPPILLFAGLQWSSLHLTPLQAGGLAFLFPGLCLVGAAMLRLAHHFDRSLATTFRWGGLSFWLWAVFILFRVGDPSVEPGTAIVNPLLQVVALVEVLSVGLVVVFLWALLRITVRNTRLEWDENLWTRTLGSRFLIFALVGIFSLGFLLTEYIGNRERRVRIDVMTAQLLFLGESLELDELDVEDGPLLWKLNPAARRTLTERLGRFLKIMPGVDDLLLLGAAENGFPRVLLRKQTRDFFQEQDTSIGISEEVLTMWRLLGPDQPALWSIHSGDSQMEAIAVVLVPTEESLGQVALVFSFQGDQWLRALARQRLPGVLATMFLLLVAVGSFMAVEGFGTSSRRVLVTRARLEMALEGARMATWEWSPSTGLLLADRRWNQILGLGEEQQISSVEEFLHLVPESHRYDLASHFDQIARQRRDELEMEFPVFTPGENSLRWVQINGRLAEKDGTEQSLVLSGTLQSVQERHRLSEEINESRERYRSLFQFSPLGIFLVESESGKFLEVNPAFCSILGYSLIELMTTTLWDLTHSGERQRCQEMAVALQPRQGFGPLETQLSNRQGQSVAVLLQGVRYPNRNGQPCLLATVQDVRLVKAAERELARSQEMHRTVIENLVEIVFQTDVEGRWTFLNSAWQQTTGFSSGESLGRSVAEYLHPTEIEKFRAIFSDLIEGRRGEIKVLANFLTKSGAQRLFDLSLRLLVDRAGEIIGTAGILRDVTKERRNLRILEAVASINSTLIASRLVGEGWREPLEMLGQSTMTNRVYVFRHHVNPNSGRLVMSQIAEWNSGEAESQLDNAALQNMDYQETGFSSWLENLRQGREINSLVRNLPPTEREFLEKQDIASVLVMPIFAGKDYWGFIGFDECYNERVWEPGELALLRSAAGAIGLRLSRQKDEDALFEATQLARAAAAQADEANRAKSTFLATMSHEIRTPLNAVIGLGSLLQETELSLQQVDYVRTMVSASNTLLDLISDILDYSKIESGKMEINREVFDLEKLVVEPLRLMSSPAAEKGLGLAWHLAPTAPRWLVGDRLRLQQILLNLLSNGIKFTEDGEISLVVDCERSAENRWHLVVRIRDTGIGIPLEALNQLFSPFQQADSSITRRFGGTGLGLAISQRLAVMMKGKIEVQSEVGQGTEFLFRVELPQGNDGQPREPFPSGEEPLAGKTALVMTDSEIRARHFQSWLRFLGCEVQARTLASPPEESDAALHYVFLDTSGPAWQEHALLSQRTSKGPHGSPELFLIANNPGVLQGIDLEDWQARYWPEFLTVEESLAHLREAKPTSPSTRPTRKKAKTMAPEVEGLRVLVAEDHPHNQKVIQYLLRKAGCEPVMVENGRLAVEKCEAQPFDLIILDLQMPVMDGLTALGEIRKIPAVQETKPVLMALTANAFSEDRDICLRAGFDRYAAKPITAAQIREIVAEVINGRHNAPGEH